MNIHIVSADCVAITARSDGFPGRRSVARIIRRELERSKLPKWTSMEIDQFSAGGETLVLARPAGVWLPGYALELLREKMDF